MADVRSTNGAGTQLQARLDNPQTVAALTRLLDRVEALEKMMGMAEEVVQQGPGLAAMVADSVDEFYANAARSGTDLEIVLENALQIARRLQNPRLTQVLTKLLDQTESLEMLVSLVEQGPGVTAMMADSLDEMMRISVESGIDFDILLNKGLVALTKFIALVESDEFDAVLDSGILDPRTVDVVGRAGRALAQSYPAGQTEPYKVGPLGLLKTLNDPDVQRALGFLTAFAKQFGRQLSTS